METELSIIDFLNTDEFRQRAEKMIEGIEVEAKELNRPVYFGDGKFCYEQWPNGRKYVLITDKVAIIQE